jgi:hypothetical protein
MYSDVGDSEAQGIVVNHTELCYEDVTRMEMTQNCVH